MIPINKILNGDALTHLKELPSESIDCVVTSPPYWALRDYGEQVQVIWDGEKDCEHEWKENVIPKQRGNLKGIWEDRNNFNANSSNKEQISNFCSKCNAWKGQLGLEPTFDLYIKHLCDVFNEVKRVLKKSGTCWVNLGDTYWGGGNNRGSSEENLSEKQFSNRGARGQNQREWNKNYQAKSLCMIPFRFAIEMVNRGWILRNSLIWHKPNVMPSSVKDRFTVDFEYLFFFVKSKKYYFETQYEPIVSINDKRLGKGRIKSKGKSMSGNYGMDSVQIGTKIPKQDLVGNPQDTGFNQRWKESQKNPYAVQPREKEFTEFRSLPDLKEFSKYLNESRKWKKITIEEIEKIMESQAPHHWFNGESYPSKEDYLKLKQILEFGDFYDKSMTEIFEKSSEKQNSIEYGRNKRAVWRITTKPFKESHFAVFPEELVETPIKAGCPEFVCNKCGKAREKIFNHKVPKMGIDLPVSVMKIDKSNPFIGGNLSQNSVLRIKGGDNYAKWKEEHPDEFVGYSDCGCNAGFSGGIVLDPFFGSGTVGVVALKNNRSFIGIELNQEYIKIAEARLKPFLEQRKI